MMAQAPMGIRPFAGQAGQAPLGGASRVIATMRHNTCKEYNIMNYITVLCLIDGITAKASTRPSFGGQAHLRPFAGQAHLRRTSPPSALCRTSPPSEDKPTFGPLQDKPTFGGQAHLRPFAGQAGQAPLGGASKAPLRSTGSPTCTKIKFKLASR